MNTYFADKPKYPLPGIEGSWVYVKYPCLVEIKLDGEFNYLHSDGDKVYLINKYGRVREDLPITEEIKALGFVGVLAGELYYDTGKSFFEEMLSHKFDDQIKFCAFDILQIGKAWIMDQELWARRLALETAIVPDKHIEISKQITCRDKAEVMAWYNKVVAQGYEGLVVKNADSRFVNGTCQSWFKLKKFNTLDLYAIGYKKDKDAIAIGRGNVYIPGQVCRLVGAVGNAGKEFYQILELVKAQEVIGEDKEYCFVAPVYCLEVKHLGVLKSGMLRNATLVKRRQDKESEVIK